MYKRQEINGPIYIYNFPDNTGYTIAPKTVVKLAKLHSNIVGMKDTISGMDHTRELIKTVKFELPEFEIYSGFDDNFAHNVLSGGNGCIGALSNVVPEVCTAWVRAFRENDLQGIANGQKVIDRLMDLYACLLYTSTTAPTPPLSTTSTPAASTGRPRAGVPSPA